MVTCPNCGGNQVYCYPLEDPTTCVCRECGERFSYPGEGPIDRIDPLMMLTGFAAVALVFALGYFIVKKKQKT